MKMESYPFDWIFSNCDVIIDCIANDFKTFLDKTQYIYISSGQCGHKKYHPLMFNHHNPLNTIDNYNYYIRCVDRFQKMLKCVKPKLFIMIFPNMTNINENIKKNIINFNNKFSKYTNNYTLLVILHLQNKQNNNHIFTYIDNIHFLELHTKSSSGGVQFNNNNDNIYLDNIIQTKYKLST
jgi:hypothetical protein